MRRLIAHALVTTALMGLWSSAWATTTAFVPDGPGGPNTLSATWNPPTRLLTIQGYFGQGATPGSWVVDGLPVYQDVQGWFNLQTTLHTDGTVDPGGQVSLRGFSAAAGLPQPTLLFSGALHGGTVPPNGGRWDLGCTVLTLADPLAAQAWNPALCTVGFDVSPTWGWDPFRLNGQPIITFDGQHNPVPEPGSWALLLTGLGLLAGYGARRQRRHLPTVVAPKAFTCSLLFAAAVLASHPASSQAHEDIGDVAQLDCRAALFLADGIHVQDFRNWYQGFLTGLVVAGEETCAATLYANGAQVVAQCPTEVGRKTVLGMLEDARRALCHAKGRPQHGGRR